MPNGTSASTPHSNSPSVVPAAPVNNPLPDCLVASFPSHPRRVDHARRLTALHLRAASPLSPDVHHTVQLLVSELVTNAIVHGSGPSVTFSLACCSSVVRVEVDDHSSTPGSPVVKCPAPEAESGRGMVLVDTLATAWGRKGTCTWCTVAVR
ncbi:ATP-binding protein [Streptomyces sp. LP05-1]|uniref:ATP-binding protein n=1 Tax=Streptomyces pyxinae TaxID=2970734 RepID=A0ABT2CP38_9ACTN|nr:ATP-binding protein [Streptomyces sp. LP05-1]MCS0639194.1 ATP-binding protein [Streptomyces sp. LP05-1]